MSAALDNSRCFPVEPLPLRLIVLSDSMPTSHALAPGEIVIGRDESCTIRIDDPSVSRRHAVVRVDGGVVLEDLDSAAGTWVGGGKLEPGEHANVRLDEVFRIGDVGVVIRQARTSRTLLTVVPDRPSMRDLRSLADRVAGGNISVLIVGETGVGKEILAEAIHRQSPRADKPFLRLNCAALSETLLESELFGHEKGSFTGAVATKVGLLETAQHGTVFLDEIGELPMSTQVKLLRVLEQRELLRVGGVASRPIDVRFVAATHRDLHDRIAQGLFRQDLYFRLNGITLQVPPLRDRLDEIEPLARKFAVDVAAALGRSTPELSEDAIDALRGHDWPGNIRELRNVMERAVLLNNGDSIQRTDLPLETRRNRLGTEPPANLSRQSEQRRRSMALDRDEILTALSRAAGNQKVAAQLLGISRRTLINKLEAFAIARPRKGIPNN